MNQTFPGLRLEAVACVVPLYDTTLGAYAERFGKDIAERYHKVVGIQRTYSVPPCDDPQPGPNPYPPLPAVGQAMDAADDILDILRDNEALRSEIDVLLHVTQTPHLDAPPESCLLQRDLGLGEHVIALDINQGCAGFMVALQTAAHFLLHPTVRHVLICGGDVLSNRVDENDHATAFMFSDVGFAALVGRGDGDWAFANGTAGSKAITLPRGGTFKMDGTDVFNFTVSKVPEQILSLRTPEVDCLLLHQSNAFIMRQIGRLCGFAPEQVPMNIADYGNASSASLPLLLCDLAQNHGWRGKRTAILSGYGCGLTWVSARMPLDFDTTQFSLTHYVT